MVNKTVVGFLMFVILSASFYVMLPDKVRIDVEKTRTKYSVDVDGSWELAATEYFNLFDGSAKMRAKNRTIEQTNYNNIIFITRISNYKDNITTIQTYTFDGSLSDVESVPVSHIAQCINCEGKIVHFEYRDILYTGETKDITSPFEFGHNMKLVWDEGSYRSKVYQQSTVADKIIIRYRPQDNVETYSIRLFDPPTDEYIYANYSVAEAPNENCFGKKDIKIDVNYTEKEAEYRNVTIEVCCGNETIGCFACKEVHTNTSCIYGCLNQTNQIFDHWKYINKTKKELWGYQCRTGVIVNGTTYFSENGLNVVGNFLYEWSVPVGDRNFEEFGTCREYEITKGVCTKTKVK